MTASTAVKKIKKFIKILLAKELVFKNSSQYWEKRYRLGGNSGTGSYNRLAEFKAEVVNSFIAENKIVSVVEHGCGDGNQLQFYKIEKYLGYDVSSKAIEICEKTFKGDATKKFRLSKDYLKEKHDLGMSMDVIYHLIEDTVFEQYMARLFDGQNAFVIIYSSNTDYNPEKTSKHVKERKFSTWIEKSKVPYELVKMIPNKYPYNGDEIDTSISDFYIYHRLANPD